MSGTTVRPAAGSAHGNVPAGLRARITGAPVMAVIAAATVLALGLRIYQLLQPGQQPPAWLRAGVPVSTSA